MIEIRPARDHDKADWLALWRGYLAFYAQPLPDHVTGLTWRRFHDPAEPMHLLGAYDGQAMIGFVAYVLHRSTWAETHYCYLEDLFVDPARRGAGVAGRLIGAVRDAARDAGCARLYWATRADNAAAQRVYDRVAEKTDFVQYRMPLA